MLYEPKHIQKSRAAKPGSFAIGKNKKARREAVFILIALIIFALCGSKAFEGAVAAPGAAVSMASFGQGATGIRQFVRSNPENVKFLKGRDLLTAFAEPELVRSELPSTLWQYRTADCVFDVYFKSDSEDVENAAVVHYEVRSRHGAPDNEVSQSGCLDSLAEQRTASFEMAPVNAFLKNRR